MRVINIIVKILTFPAAFLKGFWEQLFCKIFKVPVESKKIFQWNEMAGHIEHEPLASASKSFWYCLLTGLMTFLAGVIFAFPGLAIVYLGSASVVMRALAFGCILNAAGMFTNIFPSIEDALMMWEKYKTMGTGAKIVFGPGAVIMYVGAYAETWGITFFTNHALAALLLFI